MSVENKNVIDIVSVDKEGNAILTISDHLEWDTENEHLLMLQDKINSYLGAIEHGDLYDKHPNSRNRNIIIRVIALHKPNEAAEVFLERVKEVLKKAGYGFQFKIHDT
jgi:hypothetical protein